MKTDNAIHAAEPAPMHPILDRSARLRAAADRLGFECLDHEWQGWAASYRFQCAQGHVVIRSLQAIAQRVAGGCTECARVRRTARLHALAREAGATCLEPQWLGGTIRHRFCCKHGHHWQREGRKALEFPGCTRCARERSRLSKRLTDGLQRLRQTAAERGGVCLAEQYEGVNHPYRFRCAQGHTWQANGSDVLRRTWCPTCAIQRKVDGYRHAGGLERLRTMAACQGGQCLSTAYAGGKAHYRFRCREGHVWETTGARVLLGVWCSACAYEHKRLGLDVAHQIAGERGGRCLATEYRNNATKLPWLCHRGHSWPASLGSIRAGSWCPECAHMAQITNRKSKARGRYRPSPAGND